MEKLFATNLSVNGENIVYQVVFEDDEYIFTAEAPSASLPVFAFKRQHDEWHELRLLDPGIREQAIEALDRFLLAQH